MVVLQFNKLTADSVNTVIFQTHNLINFVNNKMYEIRCRQCREKLLGDRQQSLILNAHALPLNDPDNCPTSTTGNLLFLKEEQLPQWITTKVDESEWTKGRLNCPKCHARLGAFDYVSGSRCECNEKILPPVHIIKSKIDLVERL